MWRASRADTLWLVNATATCCAVDGWVVVIGGSGGRTSTTASSAVVCAATMMIHTVAITVTTPTCATNTTGISLAVPVAIDVVPTIAIVIAAAVGAVTVTITVACTTIMVIAETSIVAAITIVFIGVISVVAVITIVFIGVISIVAAITIVAIPSISIIAAIIIVLAVRSIVAAITIVAIPSISIVAAITIIVLAVISIVAAITIVAIPSISIIAAIIIVLAVISIVAAITIVAIPWISIVAAAIIAVTTAATARGPCTIPTVVMTTGILPITATVGHGGIMGVTRSCDRWRTHNSRTWPRQQRNTIATAREQASRAREDGFCGDGTVTIGLRRGRRRYVRRHANCTLHLVGVDVQPLAPGASRPLAAGVVVRLVHREVPGLQHLHGAHRHHQRDDDADEYAIREARHAVGVVEGALVARQQGRAGLRADTLEQLVGAAGTLDGFLVAAAVARE